MTDALGRRHYRRGSASGRARRAVVLGVFGGCEFGGYAEFLFGQERRALVIEAPAVGVHVVEPDVVGAAGVGLGEEQDRSRNARVGLENAAGQGDHGVELLVLDEHLAQGLVCVG